VSAAIVVYEVSKRFRMYHANRPNTLQAAFLGNWRLLRPRAEFLALERINFQTLRGKMVGVIGENGAGKSTLLRLIGGVIQPDSGRITTHGRLSALLELGVGFHNELTGRENVYLNGVISGLTRREIERRFDEVVHFAELEDFIDSPLRTYSSGMKMRLAFSVAIHIEPEILLIDEVLAVGDIRFQAKCLQRIKSLKSAGCTILFVSHNHTQVEELCDEALWLRAGKLAAQGPAPVVVERYLSELRGETAGQVLPDKDRSPRDLRMNVNRFGSLEMEITGVQLLSPDGAQVSELTSGEPLWIEIQYSAREAIQTPIFGVSITTPDGQIYFESNIQSALDIPIGLDRPGRALLKIDRLDLGSGNYYVVPGIYQAEWKRTYDYHWQVYALTINSTQESKGVLHPPHHWVFHS